MFDRGVFVRGLIYQLNKEIQKRILSGFLKEEYFTTGEYNTESEAHSRIQALIVKACYNLGYDVEVERGFNCGKEGRFRSDVVVYEKNKVNKPFAIIEYESTNSSDEGYWDSEKGSSDLKNLSKYMKSKSNKPNWIIISTLPKKEVDKKRWKDRYYKRFSHTQKDRDIFEEIVISPFNYYSEKYVEETQKKLKELNDRKSKICLLNLDVDTISLVKEF